MELWGNHLHAEWTVVQMADEILRKFYKTKTPYTKLDLAQLLILVSDAVVFLQLFSLKNVLQNGEKH